MKRFSNNPIHPLFDTILDRFFLQILPSIHHKIQWLDVESSSVERILLSTNYPNLYRLGLYNLEIEEAKHLFTKWSKDDLCDSTSTTIEDLQLNCIILTIRSNNQS
ncbi:unnamed protein product [Rotaria sp. Silwood2]|nr:unnamed protein product [Rotaria sp. Silwood2]